MCQICTGGSTVFEAKREADEFFLFRKDELLSP
jgi:hypothetical protein